MNIIKNYQKQYLRNIAFGSLLFSAFPCIFAQGEIDGKPGELFDDVHPQRRTLSESGDSSRNKANASNARRQRNIKNRTDSTAFTGKQRRIAPRLQRSRSFSSLGELETQPQYVMRRSSVGESNPTRAGHFRPSALNRIRRANGRNLTRRGNSLVSSTPSLYTTSTPARKSSQRSSQLSSSTSSLNTQPSQYTTSSPTQRSNQRSSQLSSSTPLLNKQSLLYTPNNKNSSEMVPPLTRQQRNTQQLLEKLKEGTSGTQSILSKGRAYKLIKKGADVNVKEVENRTPLHWAIWNNPKLASVLIDKGADIRARDEHGDTSLIGPQVKEIWQ